MRFAKLSVSMLMGFALQSASTAADSTISTQPISDNHPTSLSLESIGNEAARDVIVVGNNWDGTIDIYDPYTHQRIKKLNAVPDKEERLQELNCSVKRWVMSTLIKEVIGEGNYQMVDDMFPSNDGRHLFISRPSFRCDCP